MKKYILIALVALLAACDKKDPKQSVEQNVEYSSFGEAITVSESVPVSQLVSQMATTDGDSVYTKVTGKVVDVCQAKGCWMKLDLGNNETMRVTFKDYGFFVPKDSKGKEVVIEGVMLKKVTPVDELRHYASDAGKSEAEIAQITESQSEIAFEAVGVLMK